MTSVWIVVVNFDGLEDTQPCLRSIAAQSYPALATVVVDNGSQIDPSAALRVQFPWCHVIRQTGNLGFAGGANAGIRRAIARGAELVVLLNNDTVVAADFAERLVRAARAYPEFGVIGPVINWMESPWEVMTDGCVFNPPWATGFFPRKVVPLVTKDPPTITPVDIVNGCCMMVRTEVFARIGLIDERFFLVHEESDFCLRAQRAGFRCGVIGEPLVWHKGSMSFKRSGRALQRYYDARNLPLLLKRHRDPERRGALRSWGTYLTYVYYRYAAERQDGQERAARAIIDGLCDAAAGRYGPHHARHRWLAPIVEGLFELWRGRPRLHAPQDTTHAVTLR